MFSTLAILGVGLLFIWMVWRIKRSIEEVLQLKAELKAVEKKAEYYAKISKQLSDPVSYDDLLDSLRKGDF